MPRRFHNKSRFGCTECKLRRVKCDEGQPICGRCVRTRLKCHYPRGQTNPESPPSLSVGSGTPPSSFDLLDMTLMHHYTTHTCKHLFMGERQGQVWQYDVPAFAASNVMLVHGFLAVTALHRARDDPARRDLYRTRALHHHGVGLPLFQEKVASASPEKAEVIVVYSILLSIWVYAFPEIAEEQPALDDILTTIDVVRGSRSVFRLYRAVVMETPIGHFLVPPFSAAVPDDQASSVRETLQSLRNQMQHPADESAVHRLQRVLERYLTGRDHTRSAANWMASVEDDYWLRLRNHQPHALLVFAYSTLLVRASERGCWWMSGWSERILRACSDVLGAEEKETMGWEGHEQRIRTQADELASVVGSKHEYTT
ncbi:hypothetical protein CC80DRAFT_478475 [Byssothecium circinans]|uniref:Zn(2)-C6 fungal-type domain-containing protein n=1 Tax=Byssothecium circinans TaxID=147558 RepID=A0A6A5TMA3_9PLEO|nr:hypothetical protein CC80DRAFT_478475 [Byssothecium circinans]